MHLESMCFSYWFLAATTPLRSGRSSAHGRCGFSTYSSPLSERRMSALSDRGFVLMLQKNPEREAVRDEQQRDDQRGDEVRRAQLPRRKAGRIGLVKGVHEIDETPELKIHATSKPGALCS